MHNQTKPMKAQLKRTIILALAAVCGAATIQAQTVISGPNINSSTWSPTGSPYIITADCTVPSGQTLTILPGTMVWMGSGTSLTGNGIISAVGTAAQPITFKPPVLSQMWNSIIINNTVGTNRFTHCEFYNATNALDCRGASRNEIAYCAISNSLYGLTFRDNSINTVELCSFRASTNGIWMTVSLPSWIPTLREQSTTIRNCEFLGVSGDAIYGEAIGFAAGFPCYCHQSARIAARIVNCAFENVGRGCRFFIRGYGDQFAGYGYGYGDISVLNNTFKTVAATAVSLTATTLAATSPANLLNNSIINAGVGTGIVTQDPWDAIIQNNIIKGALLGVSRSGTLSATVSYNDFHLNNVNFSGYPVTYGQAILANRNGTPCDVLFNIFSDPMLVSSSDLHLQPASPCIDAGEGSGANFDSYFPPSMGSITNDIGAYGGPNAGLWFQPPSTNTFSLGITRIPYVSVTVNPPEPGNYRLEYASALLGTNTWIQITNLSLTTVPFTYTEPAVVPARYYRAVKL